MSNVLLQTRMIIIHGEPTQFVGYNALGVAAENLVASLGQLDRSLSETGVDRLQIYANIAWQATALADVLTAQEMWLSDDNDARTIEIEALRHNIRKLNVLPSNMPPGESS